MTRGGIRAGLIACSIVCVAAAVRTQTPPPTDTPQPPPASGAAQTPPPAGATPSRPPGPPPGPPKNLLVLNGMSGAEVRSIMQTLVSPSLGVRCDFCHERGDFASDAKPEKLKARAMMKMTAGLNDANFSADTQGNSAVGGRVTCFTCHHGQQQPDRTPPPKPPAF
jgi:hypothetical protein